MYKLAWCFNLKHWDHVERPVIIWAKALQIHIDCLPVMLIPEHHCLVHLLLADLYVTKINVFLKVKLKLGKWAFHLSLTWEYLRTQLGLVSYNMNCLVFQMVMGAPMVSYCDPLFWPIICSSPSALQELAWTGIPVRFVGHHHSSFPVVERVSEQYSICKNHLHNII